MNMIGVALYMVTACIVTVVGLALIFGEDA